MLSRFFDGSTHTRIYYSTHMAMDHVVGSHVDSSAMPEDRGLPWPRTKGVACNLLICDAIISNWKKNVTQKCLLCVSTDD